MKLIKICARYIHSVNLSHGFLAFLSAHMWLYVSLTLTSFLIQSCRSRSETIEISVRKTSSSVVSNRFLSYTCTFKVVRSLMFVILVTKMYNWSIYSISTVHSVHTVGKLRFLFNSEVSGTWFLSRYLPWTALLWPPESLRWILDQEMSFNVQQSVSSSLNSFHSLCFYTTEFND